MHRNIVVTGLGCISPLGLTVGESWKRVSQGIGGIDRVTKFDVEGFRSQIAGEVKGYVPETIPVKERKKMDTFIQYAVSAAGEALKDAGLTIDDSIAEEVGVMIGSGIGGLPAIERYRDVCRDRGESRINPFFIPMAISNMASGQVSIFYNTKNYNATVTSACATSNHSIGDAARIIERGDAKAMICGGTESTICPLALGGFGAMKALSTNNANPRKASRPYDVDRDGFVLGEGCGILVLEDEEFARKRGADIYCRLLGYGFSSDAHHMTLPTVEGPMRAMRNALKDAAVNPDEIDYINAHGTSTPAGDINELKAVKKALGEEAAKKASISATKSMTGHMLGGTGGVEAVFSIMAMRDGIVPPSINIENLDPECDLDVTPNAPKERTIRHAMSNGFGFGSTNSTIIFGASG